MKNQEPYKTPEGFDQVYSSENGVPVLMPFCFGLVIGSKPASSAEGFSPGHILKFEADGKNIPKLPILAFGQLEHMGLDEVTHYAIDADRRCYKHTSAYYGGCMTPCSQNDLLCNAETQEQKNEIRRHLGLKPLLPLWIPEARAAGWTPPEGWDESQWA